MNRFHFLLVWSVAGLLARGVAADPEVFVSLRGVVNETIEVGEPLFVAARIELPPGATRPLELAPATGTWVEAVRVTLIGTGATPLQAVPTLVPAASTITVDADHAAMGEWLFDAAATARLGPGTHRVQVRLAVAAGAGWTGEVTSDELTVNVVAPSISPERVTQRTAAQANAALAAGAPEEAARVLDAVLANQPDNVRLLVLRARVCAAGGDLPSALACVYRADDVITAQGVTHPSTMLFEMRQQLLVARQNRPADPTPPPAWTKLPASLLAPFVPGKVAGGPAGSIPTSAAGSEGASGTVVPVAELTEADILADPSGQWVASAQAGSQYSTPNYGAVQLIGPPNVSTGSDNPRAWCHHSSAKGLEWVELTFAKPVNATEVRVRQNYNPGAIVRVEAIDGNGASHLWWQGVDPARPPGALNAIAWFAVRVPRTEYRVAKIKLTLDLDAVPSYQEIDAVQLVGTQ